MIGHKKAIRSTLCVHTSHGGQPLSIVDMLILFWSAVIVASADYSSMSLLVSSSRASLKSLVRRRSPAAAFSVGPSFSSTPAARRFGSSKAIQQAETEEAASSKASVSNDQLLQGSNTESLGAIIRHGPGDACLTLNVGGKLFYTLRSTACSNAVLSDHVARAEANSEITKDGAVFIDRDPKHFGVILTHLRNCMEKRASNMSENGSCSQMSAAKLKEWTKFHTELPKDARALRELYAEATFYRIQELCDAICGQKWLVSLFSFFNKNAANPFHSVTKLASQVRAGLIAIGSLGTVGGTTVVVAKSDEYLDWFVKKLGLEKKDGGGGSSSNVAGA